jgi:hypothetical protein
MTRTAKSNPRARAREHSVLDRLSGRHLSYRKIIVSSLRNKLHVDLPEDVALAVRFASAKTGIAADELIADVLRDAFGSVILPNREDN